MIKFARQHVDHLPLPGAAAGPRGPGERPAGRGGHAVQLLDSIAWTVVGVKWDWGGIHGAGIREPGRERARGVRRGLRAGGEEAFEEGVDVEEVDEAVAVDVGGDLPAVGVGGGVGGGVEEGEEEGVDVEEVDGAVAVRVAALGTGIQTNASTDVEAEVRPVK